MRSASGNRTRHETRNGLTRQGSDTRERGYNDRPSLVYLDHASTTPLRREVFEAMELYLTQRFGNPSSLYRLGREARLAVEDAREKVSRLIGAEPEEIYFTSGGSESDNMAIKGMAFTRRDEGRHIITSAVEHHAVLHTCKFLEEFGFRVTYLPVDGYGMVDPDEVKKAMRDDTILVSVMTANNEVGTVQPIKEIASLAREKGVAIHTDAVQAAGTMNMDVNDLGVDMLSMSSHKMYGPKGVGALYVKKGIKIHPLIHGGSQERNRRAGTENVPGIVGFGKAAELALSSMRIYDTHVRALRDRLIQGIIEHIEDVSLNGHPTMRLPNNASFCIRYAEGEALLVSLDMEGICCSSGSACTSGSLEPSHVLMAMGIPLEVAQGSLRFTFGTENTHEDVDRVLEVLPAVVKRLREMSRSIPSRHI